MNWAIALVVLAAWGGLALAVPGCMGAVSTTAMLIAAAGVAVLLCMPTAIGMLVTFVVPDPLVRALLVALPVAGVAYAQAATGCVADGVLVAEGALLAVYLLLELGPGRAGPV